MENIYIIETDKGIYNISASNKERAKEYVKRDYPDENIKKVSLMQKGRKIFIEDEKILGKLR